MNFRFRRPFFAPIFFPWLPSFLSSKMKLKKRKLFEDLHSLGSKPGDKDYREKAEEYAKRFFIVNEDRVAQKTLDEIGSEVLKFVVRVRQFWNSRSVARHVDRMPLDHAFFANDITIIVEREHFVEVPVPGPPTRASKPFEDKSRSGKFAAAKDVRDNHDVGAILMASYGAAKSSGQGDLAKVIKVARDAPEVAAKAVEGLEAESK